MTATAKQKQTQQDAFRAALHRGAALLFLALTFACGTSAGANPTEKAQQTSEAIVPDGTNTADAALAPDGYIFVATRGGEPVQGDMFNVPDDAYLFGFVPDGDYLVQVTNEDCTELLAGPDAPGDVPNTIGKVVTVRGGEFEAHPLAPFLTATDGSGVHRVMLVPLGERGLPGEGCYGVDPENAFSTFFSIVPGPLTDASYCATGGVFLGETPGQGGLEDVRVVLYSSKQAQPVTETYSAKDGMFSVCGLQPGEDYQLKQVAPPGYEQVEPEADYVEFSNLGRDDLYVPPFRMVASK